MQDQNLFEKVVPELILTLRNRSSQAQLSRRMGYKSNRVHRWENNSRHINWREFAKLCRVQGFPLEKALYQQVKYQGASEDSAGLVKHFIGHSSLKDFSRAVEFSSSLVSKWSSGAVVPKLSQVLQLIDRLHGLSVEFLDTLVKYRQLTSLSTLRSLKHQQRSVLARFPEAGAFLATLAMSNSTYQDVMKGWKCLGQKLKMTSSRRCELIRSLFESGWIESVEKTIRLNSVRLDTRGDLDVAVQLRKYWIEKASEFLQDANDMVAPHRFAYLIVALSADADAKAADAYHKYILQLKEIVTNDQALKTRLRVVNVQDLWLNHEL